MQNSSDLVQGKYFQI